MCPTSCPWSCLVHFDTYSHFGWSFFALIKKNKIFLIYKEIQNGAVEVIYEEGLPNILGNAQIFNHILYEEAVCHIWLCNCSILNFLIYEKNLIFFFISVLVLKSPGVKKLTTKFFCTSACLQPKSSLLKFFLKNWNATLTRKTNLRISAAGNNSPCPACYATLLKQLLLFISLGTECAIVDEILF